MRQRNRFPSVPKNLTALPLSPLNEVPTSRAGICQALAPAGFQSWACCRTRGDLMETASRPWTFLGLVSPPGPHCQLQTSMAQGKTKTRHRQEEAREESIPERKETPTGDRAACGSGSSGDGLDTNTEGWPLARGSPGSASHLKQARTRCEMGGRRQF